jgi:hypothetical protein
MPQDKQETVKFNFDAPQDLAKRIEAAPKKNKAEFFRRAVEDYLKREEEDRTGQKEDAPSEVPPKRLGEFQRDLIESVTSNLRDYTEWTKQTILDLQLVLEGESIFARRVDHFRSEKRHISNAIVPWIVKRILFFAGQGHRVYLLIDSGTSLYWVFRRLEQGLKEQLKQGEEKQKLLRRITILTNNTAGAYSYVSASNIESLEGKQRPTPVLADYVKCHVLGGEIVTRYAATLGPETVAALRREKERAMNGEGSVKFIGLLVGQWVRIDEDTPHRPIALARGYGQSEFKRELILISDEVFLISPLAKLFRLPYDDIKDGLGKDSSDSVYVDVGQAIKEDDWQDGDRREFEERSKTIKLVTTLRSPSKMNPAQALGNFSSAIHGLYGNRYLKRLSDELAEEPNFSSLPHLYCDFDLPGTPTEQCEIEFPHVPAVGESGSGHVSMDFLREAFLLGEFAQGWHGPKRH